MRVLIGCGLALTAVVAACGSLPGQDSGAEKASIPGYRVVADVPLPGNTGRWDYQVLDAQSHRLYVAHLGASEVVVFDTSKRAVAGVVRGVNSVHGLALAPDLDRLFASATGANEVAAIDLQSLTVVSKAAAGDYPDGLDYVPDHNAVFVSDEQGSGDTVIDARSVKTLRSITLGGDIGNTKYDPMSKSVFVAVGSSNQLVAIDPSSDSVSERYDLPDCQGAHGVQLIATPHRAFVGCESNSKIVAIDLDAKRVVGSASVGDTPDVLAYDSGLQRVYVACEDGTLWVLEANGDVKVVAHGNAGPNAHTVAVDPLTHYVYMPLTDVAGRPVLRVLSP